MGKGFVFFLLMLSSNVAAQSKRAVPNVVVILADDLGWADLACYGSSFYETPNLDRLAKKGIKFTRAYATSPVCSPTRASLLTGKYPVRTGITDWIPGRQAKGVTTAFEKLLGPACRNELDPGEQTLAEHALTNGYKTFFAGKWHLGEEEKYRPQSQGFQQNIGGWGKGSPVGRINDSTGAFFVPYNNPTIKDGPPGEYLTDRLTDECLSFIQSNKETPFFLLYSLYAVHNPLQAPSSLINKYEKKRLSLSVDTKNRFAKDEDWMKDDPGWKRRLIQDNPVYAAMIENMDSNIGRILETLEQLNLSGNTIFVFVSDNGGLSTAEGSPTTNGSLRNGKGWLYEGGIRVPMIMYWPEKLTGGLVSDLPVTVADIFPTIAKAIDPKYRNTNEIDGKDIIALLKNSPNNYNRPLYWHYPHYSNQGGRPGSAIVEGKYKLIYHHEDKSLELYDLSADRSERNNIAQSETGTAKSLQQKLHNWLKEVKAKFPEANPGFLKKN